MESKSFDKKFDGGHDITKYLDFKSARRINRQQKQTNTNFPLPPNPPYFPFKSPNE